MAITMRAARVNVGLTQSEAADRLGVTEATLHNYECGKTAPTVLIALKMVKLYGVGLEDLFFLPDNSI